MAYRLDGLLAGLPTDWINRIGLLPLFLNFIGNRPRVSTCNAVINGCVIISGYRLLLICCQPTDTAV